MDELKLRAGKSSCIKTVFQDIPVADVPYFDATQKVEKVIYEQVYPDRSLCQLRLTVQLHSPSRNLGYAVKL